MSCKGVSNVFVCAQFPHMWLNVFQNLVYRVVVDGWEIDRRNFLKKLKNKKVDSFGFPVHFEMGQHSRSQPLRQQKAKQNGQTRCDMSRLEVGQCLEIGYGSCAALGIPWYSSHLLSYKLCDSIVNSLPYSCNRMTLNRLVTVIFLLRERHLITDFVLTRGSFCQKCVI